MVKVAIVCEGKNDRDFLQALISHLGLAVVNQINFYIFRGKSELLNPDHDRYLDDLKLEIEAGQISKILFVVDADNDESDAIKGGYENTQTALDALMAKLDVITISQSHIFCDPKTKLGYLESFVLSTISEAEKNCIERFLECSQFHSKESHKAILNQIYKTAYPNAPYNFSHPNFERLKAVLTQLFT